MVRTQGLRRLAAVPVYLALKDYNNKAPDDEGATVPCLDIEA